MYRGGCNPQYKPQNFPLPAQKSDVSQTAGTNIQPNILWMGAINIISSWGSQALHAVVARSQHDSAEDIDQQM